MADVVWGRPNRHAQWHDPAPRRASRGLFVGLFVVIACVTWMSVRLMAPRHSVVFRPHWQPSEACDPDLSLTRGVRRMLQREMRAACVDRDVVVAPQFDVDGFPSKHCLALLCNSGSWLENVRVTLRSSSTVSCRLDTGIVHHHACPVSLSTGATITDRTMCCIVNHALNLLSS